MASATMPKSWSENARVISGSPFFCIRPSREASAANVWVSQASAIAAFGTAKAGAAATMMAWANAGKGVAARLVISQWRAVRFPANRAYILRNTSRAHEQLSRLRTIGVDEITARVRDAGRPEDAFTPEEPHA